MKRTNLIAVLVGFVALVAVSQDTFARGRMYHPGLGVFMQRDPVGTPLEPLMARNLSGSQYTQRDSSEQYAEGPNLYRYVRSNPIAYTDPMGLWSEDVHRDMTKKLAEIAHFACADEVAKYANRPDEDDRRSGIMGVLDTIPLAAIDAQEIKLALMRKWHFPADTDGIVRTDSIVANAEVEYGINTCNLVTFAEGLHVLQDSWAHQGRPYKSGVGHYRGAKYITRLVFVLQPGSGGRYRPQLVGTWVRVDGTWDAATNTGKGNADDVTFWPDDARATGMATYNALFRFRQHCPCSCPGHKSTTDDPARGYDQYWPGYVSQILEQMYPGHNWVTNTEDQLHILYDSSESIE